ncbi:MAG TPA: hypothetical protein VEB88_00400 [Candidatus Acidoferrales bacterium]|nr:hypothetical protein [Candidatus Acidoferrales bacterium]
MSDAELEKFVLEKIRQLGVDGLYDNPKLTLVAELIYGTIDNALEAALNYDIVDEIIALYRTRFDMTAISAETEHLELYNKAVNDYGSWRGALKAAKMKCEQMRAIEKDEWVFPYFKTPNAAKRHAVDTDADNITNSGSD